MPEPKLYSELAPWWPLLSAPGDYAEEAGIYRRILAEACDPKTVLELGSGGGNTASHLKAHFEMTLVDRAPGMLDVSRALNPECTHFEGDMRAVRLASQFDAVFVHDAIAYLTSERDLAAAIATAFAHCRPGGAALFVPDCLRETFTPETDSGGHDGEGRALRYLEWRHDPDPTDDTYTVDYAILLRGRDQSVRVVQDRHVCGFFARERWLSLCRTAGFEPRVVEATLTDPHCEVKMILCVRA